MNKKYQIEIEIKNYLQDIKNYTNGALRYIKAPETINDPEELIYSLLAVDEIIEIIENLIYELEEKYKHE